MPAQQLTNHKMAHILIRPIAQMASNRRQQIDVKRALLDRIIDAAVGIQPANFGFFSAQFLASLFRLVQLVRVGV